MAKFMTIPVSDIDSLSGLPVSGANAVFSPDSVLTGLSNNVAYQTYSISNPSNVFTPQVQFLTFNVGTKPPMGPYVEGDGLGGNVVTLDISGTYRGMSTITGWTTSFPVGVTMDAEAEEIYIDLDATGLLTNQLVTAMPHNTNGDADVALSWLLTVNAAPVAPFAIGTIPNQTWIEGQDVEWDLSPYVGGDAPIVLSVIEDALPTGLSFDTEDPLLVVGTVGSATVGSARFRASNGVLPNLDMNSFDWEIVVPSFSAQTAQFGDGVNARYRPYDDNDNILMLTGTPSLQSGSAGGYTAQISDGGLWFGAGNGAPHGAVYRCDLAIGGTIDIQIEVVTDADSVAPGALSNVNSRITAMRASNPNVDWTLILRGGEYGTHGAAVFDFAGQVFNGTVIDGNEGLEWHELDHDAVATVSGGSMLVTSDRKWAAKINQRVNSLGSGPIFWHYLDFCEHAPSPKVAEGDGNSYNSTWFQFNHEFYGAYPADKINVTQRCRFGRAGNGMSTGYTIGACRFDNRSIVEDCEFFGVSFGVGGRITTARRNVADMVVEDFRRIGFGATTPLECWCYSNEVFRRDPDTMWAGNHADGFQIGATTTTAKLTIYLVKNKVYDLINGIQGLAYCDDSSEAINGVVANCLYFGVHVRALQTRRPEDFLMINNTILAPPNGVSLGPSLPQIKVELLTDTAPPRGPHVLSINNLVVGESAIPEEIGMSYGTLVIPQTGDGYAAVMTGPFTGGSGAPVWSDWATVGTLPPDEARPLVDAMLATIGAGVGKGHTATPDLGFPAIKSFAATTGAAPSTPTSCGQKRVHRGTGLAVSITGASAQFRVLASDGVTVLRDWGSGATTVNKGEIVEPRITSSGTSLATVSGTLTIDGDAFPFSVQTATVVSSQFTIGAGTPNTMFVDTVNIAASTTKLVGKMKLEMPSAPAGDVHLFGQQTNAWRLQISASRQLTVSVRDSANVTVLAGTTVLDSIGNPVVVPTGQVVDLEFSVDHVAHQVLVKVNGVTHPAIPFTSSGTGSQRQQPILIGASSPGGANNWPAGWKLSDVEIWRNDALYKAIPNTAAGVNADPWKAGANAT